MNKSPCYKCAKRTQICHAQCEDYHAWVTLVKQHNEAKHKDDPAKEYARYNYDRWHKK